MRRNSRGKKKKKKWRGKVEANSFVSQLSFDGEVGVRCVQWSDWSEANSGQKISHLVSSKQHSRLFSRQIQTTQTGCHTCALHFKHIVSSAADLVSAEEKWVDEGAYIFIYLL